MQQRAGRPGVVISQAGGMREDCNCKALAAAIAISRGVEGLAAAYRGQGLQLADGSGGGWQ